MEAYETQKKIDKFKKQIEKLRENEKKNINKICMKQLEISKLYIDITRDQIKNNGGINYYWNAMNDALTSTAWKDLEKYQCIYRPFAIDLEKI